MEKGVNSGSVTSGARCLSRGLELPRGLATCLRRAGRGCSEGLGLAEPRREGRGRGWENRTVLCSVASLYFLSAVGAIEAKSLALLHH